MDVLTGERCTTSEVASTHARFVAAVGEARRVAARPLTYVEKLVASHLVGGIDAYLGRREASVDLAPDRLAMPDSSSLFALLQFMLAERDRVALPTTIHGDHLVEAREGGVGDLDRALEDNAEVYEFIESAARRFGIGYWRPGSGIIHQVLLEQYVYPGALVFGADSHTPTAGGLGALGIGGGGATAVDIMLGGPFQVPRPKLIGVHLVGDLDGWSTPKDVILQVCRELTVQGGTGAIIEYLGPGAAGLSTTGKATICNMGAEAGATSSVFPFDAAGVGYMRSTGRDEVADLLETWDDFRADPEVEADPGAFFDRLIEIDLGSLRPQITGPGSPDLGVEIGLLARGPVERDYPLTISQALIGSCTNSSYADLGRAAHVARQAAAAGLRVRTPLMVTPGSERVRRTLERDGVLADLEAIGATVLANACGPCIGQWTRHDEAKDGTNTIVTSFNRNFPRRNDGSAETRAFVTSPELVVALALAGRLDFDPTADELPTDGGDTIRLSPPAHAELPAGGLVDAGGGFAAPSSDPSSVAIVVRPDSERVQLLQPFEAWDDDARGGLPILMKAVGRCTTDHMSPAGREWMRFRAHLDRLSDNLFIQVTNAFSSGIGYGVDPMDGIERPLPEVARRLRDAGRRWVVVGEDNFGEGSSREYPVMSARHFGCVAVVAKSIARIHESNLKKHGALPLTFDDPADFDRITSDAHIDLPPLADIRPDRSVVLRVVDGEGAWDLVCSHTLTSAELEWLRHGSALNAIRAAEAP